MSFLNVPRFLPNCEPDLISLDIDVFAQCPVPGYTDKDNDGTLFYYDQPLLFSAKMNNKLVLVTLLDQDYTNDGMQDGYALNAKGWDQYLAVVVSEGLLLKVVTSELPLRTAYEDIAQTFYIHKNWCALRVEGLERHDPRNWYSVYRVWNNVPVFNKWKPAVGAFLNPNK